MLSKRLLASTKYLNGFNCLADCGTDHGYLPIYAVKHNLVKKAIASDNKLGPLENAKKNILEHGLDIVTILADGVPYLNEEIDLLSILGMGGRLIKSILNEADLSHLKRLVLSPNSEAYVVREYLQNNNFMIVDEEIVKDKHKYYQIIVAEPGKMVLSDIEKEFGPLIIQKQSNEFKAFIAGLINQLEEAVSNVIDEDKKESIILRIKELKEVIS
jgi:tRNA (adenine22-N1)-methyltransferase